MIYTTLCYKFCLKHEKKQEEDKSVPVIMAVDQYAQFIAMSCVGKYEMFCFTSRRFTRWDKRLLYVKRNKEISLEKFHYQFESSEFEPLDSFERVNEIDVRSEASSWQNIEEEVVPKVDDVSLVDEVFYGAFGRDREEDVVMGEGVVVTSSSLEMLTKSFLGVTSSSLHQMRVWLLFNIYHSFDHKAQSPSHEVRRMQERDSSERRKDLFNAHNFKEIVWLEFLMISAEA
ncbi:hypothetical protein Tco_1078759 [Tanacetum coccineum]|uniref:Uncharacterized protein n=1 Tax=Tanacetum coccineum TaxID=301880 RepID=A0ABQ5HQT7_9ASTR